MHLFQCDTSWDSAAAELDEDWAKWQRNLADVRRRRQLADRGAIHVAKRIYKLKLGNTNGRYFIEVRVIDGTTLVGIALAGMLHGTTYDRLSQQLRRGGSERLERRSSNISDEAVRRRLRAAEPAAAAPVEPVRVPLAAWLQPLHRLSEVLHPTEAVLEDANWRTWIAAQDVDTRRRVLGKVRAARTEGTDRLIEQSAEVTFVDDEIHLRGPHGTEEHGGDRFVRRYGTDVLAGGEDGERWLALAEDASPDTDPCLELDEKEVAALERATENLPMLIDGPAGSGKSTVLSYITAHLINRVMHDNETRSADQPLGSPLLVTMSGPLVADTRRRIAKQLGVRFGWEPGDAIEASHGACMTLDDLFREVLGRPEDFPDGAKVRYHDVRTWISRQGGSLAGLDAADAWWLLRAIVLGWTDLAAAGGHDEIAELVTRDGGLLPRSVHEEIENRLGQPLSHDLVEELVHRYREWKHGRSKRGQQRWDDSDLARGTSQALSSDYEARHRTVAIAIDEAQDLTRQQLGVMVDLLEQSIYELRQEGAPVLPLLFAADPEQEVTGSGFSWDRFRGLLGSIIDELTGSSTIPDPARLELNHRSQAHIVTIANRVQELRGRDRPQQRPAKRPAEPVHVVSLEGSNHAVAREAIATGTVVLPVLGTEARTEDKLGKAETEYLSDHPALQAVFTESPNNGQTLARLQTPYRTKGRAFSFVVAYDFERFASGGGAPQEWASLYVTATRAVHGLLFVERTEDSARMLRHSLGIPDTELTPDVVARLASEQDDEADALEAFRVGLHGRDPNQLYDAADLFDRIGDAPAAAVAVAMADSLPDEHFDPAVAVDLAGKALNIWTSWALEAREWDLVLLPSATPSLPRGLALVGHGRPDEGLPALADGLTEQDTRDPLYARAVQTLYAAVRQAGPDRMGLSRSTWNELAEVINGAPSGALQERAYTWAALHAGHTDEALSWVEDLNDKQLERDVTIAASGVSWVPLDLLRTIDLDDGEQVAGAAADALRNRPGVLELALDDLPDLLAERPLVAQTILAHASSTAADAAERLATTTKEELQWLIT